MKIIIFNDEKEVLDVMEDIEDPKPISRTEIKWLNGGASGLQQNYVIVGDDQTLEDLTDEEIEAQHKMQAKIELARRYEENRIEALALGKEEEEQAAFLAARDKVDKAKGKEKITVEMLGYKNKGRFISEMLKQQNNNRAEDQAQNTE